ncbi:hypothetical protein ACS0TY_030319 [Phlomoides rotata]
MVSENVELHPDIPKQFWDQQHWPKHILIREEQSEIDVASGFYVLFGSGYLVQASCKVFLGCTDMLTQTSCAYMVNNRLVALSTSRLS